jgi:hypothetical protein
VNPPVLPLFGFVETTISRLIHPETSCEFKQTTGTPKIAGRHEISPQGENVQPEHFTFISATNTQTSILQTDTLHYQRRKKLFIGKL